MSTLKELRDQARELGIKGASKMNTEAVTAAIAAKQKESGIFEVEIPSDGSRPVKVSRSGDEIVVTWVCGGTREFTPEDLRTALDRFALIGERARIWYQDTDSASYKYAAVLKDGEFHANDYVNGDNHHVPWVEFKKALEDSIA